MSDFDKIIRERLLTYRHEEQLPDWNSMKDKLAEDAFDQSIALKLKTGESATAFSSDWESMSESLDADSFDVKIKSALGGSLNLTNSSDWSTMEGFIERASVEDQNLFDELITNKLNESQHEVKGWQQLSYRMDTFWLTRRVLRNYRIPEIAAAILLFMTFVPLLQDNPMFDRNEGLVSSTNHANDLKVNKQEFSQVDINEIDYLNQKSTFKRTSGVESTILKEDVNYLQSSVDIPKASFFKYSHVKPILLTNEPNENKAKLFDQMSIEKISDYSKVNYNDNFLVNYLPKRESYPLKLQNALGPNLLSTEIGKKKSKWSLSLYSGFRRWVIKLGSEQYFDINERETYSTGFVTGLSLRRKLNDRWNLNLGLGYTDLTYNPQLPVVFRQNVVSTQVSLDAAEAIALKRNHLLELPLSVGYELPISKKWFVSAKLGASFLTSLNANYQSFQKNDNFDEFRSIATDHQNSFKVANQLYSENSFAESKTNSEFDESVYENSFLSVFAGFNIGYNLNDKYSLTLGVDGSQFLPVLKGIGNSFDQPSNLGVNLTLSMNL